jgi:uroporphyrinogen decarboxylase
VCYLFGTTDDVKDEVRKRIRDLAPNGDYVLGAVHNIQPEVPPENICTMFEAAMKYGQYPIKIG